MRAFLVTAPGVGRVQDVAPPAPGVGQVVVDVAFSGICGTDTALFHGSPAHLEAVRSSFPLRLGHEWSGTVSALGQETDPSWLGRRVTGDTMLGCGHCPRCLDGRHFVCEERYEIGVRRNWPGALAEKLLVPQSALYPLPETVTEEMGALVEPGANAYRAVAASGVQPGWRVLVIGPGTIGLLCAQFALAAGCEVHVLGHSERSLERARRFGVKDAWIQGELPPLAWDAVIDASDEPPIPQQAVDLVEPGRRVVFIGISEDPSYIDSRMVALKDLTSVGILGGSLGLRATIDAYASGSVNPVPFIGAKVSLEDVAVALEGRVLVPDGAGPKILVDPRL